MASTDTSPEIVEQILLDALAEMGPERSDLRREATLEELDIDSLDIVELAQIVEERWGVELEPQDFEDVKTVGQALDAVSARVS